MRLPTSSAKRRGLSLMEVLVALAIFVMGFVALGQILTLSSNQAVEIKFQSIATRMAQSKMAQAVSGIIPLSSQSQVSDDDDPDWYWSIEVSQANLPGVTAIPDAFQSYFQSVTIRVSHADPTGNMTDYCVLTQLVLDPSQRGTAKDTITATNSTATSSSGSGSGSSTGSSTGAGSTGSGGTGGATGGSSMGGGGGGNATGGAALNNGQGSIIRVPGG